MVELQKKYPYYPSSLKVYAKAKGSRKTLPINMPIGSICFFIKKDASNVTQDNSPWKECNGQSLPVDEYPQLDPLVSVGSLIADDENINLPNITGESMIKANQDKFADRDSSAFPTSLKVLASLFTDLDVVRYGSNPNVPSILTGLHIVWSQCFQRSANALNSRQSSKNIALTDTLRKSYVRAFMFVGLSSTTAKNLTTTSIKRILSDAFVEKMGSLYVPENHVATLYKSSYSYFSSVPYGGVLTVKDRDGNVLDTVAYTVQTDNASTYGSENEVSFERSLSIDGEAYVETSTSISINWVIWNKKGVHPCVFGTVAEDKYECMEQFGYDKTVIASSLDVQIGDKVVVGTPQDYPASVALLTRDDLFVSLFSKGYLQEVSGLKNIGGVWYKLFETRPSTTNFRNVYTVLFGDKLR